MNGSRWMACLALAALFLAPEAPGFDGGAVSKITLQEVLSIGDLNDDNLFQWTGVAVGRGGDIYVLDAMDCALKKFDARGALVKKTGRRGQGPGEFMLPRLLDASPNFLFASDQNIAGVLVFDLELNYVKKIPCPTLIAHLKALGDDRVAVASMSFQGPGRILVLSGEGKILSEISYFEGSAGLLMDSISFIPGADGGFYIAFLFQDRIEKWSPDGRRLWSRHLLGGTKSETKKFESFNLPSDTYFKDIAVDARGHIFVLGGAMAKAPGRTVYVLNTEGNLQTTFDLPDTSHCLYLDRDGYLYGRANDGITLKKFRILYE